MANIPPFPRIVRGSLLAFSGIFCASVNASGLAISELSALGISTSNTLTANTREPGALPYNPSLGAFHDQFSISGHFMDIQADIAVTPSGGSYTKSEHPDHILIPGLTVNAPLDNDLTLTVNVNAPYAVVTEWPLGTFPGIASHLSGLVQPTKSKLETVRISPSVAFKTTEDSALALGIDYYIIKKIILSAAAQENELDGDGWGFNASFTQRVTPKLTFGADYHSRGSIKAEGTTTFGGNTFDAQMDDSPPLPWRLQFGLAYDITPDFTLEFDVTRTGWGSYRIIKIDSPRSTISENYWKDSNAYRLGMEYRWNDRLRLRTGYSYDHTPQGDDYFGGRAATNNQHMLGLGIGYDFAEDLTLDVGYMYVKAEDRSFHSDTPPTGANLHGSSAYNGLYEMDAHVVGLSLIKRF